jgi:hypothetical protein
VIEHAPPRLPIEPDGTHDLAAEPVAGPWHAPGVQWGCQARP